jgi:hypothetical protein
MGRGQTPVLVWLRYSVLPPATRSHPFRCESRQATPNRLVDRLADRLVSSVSYLAGGPERKHRDDALSIPDRAKYATSDQLAARYQLSVQWVESRATRLGATPISDSTNSKLRYHLATADADMDSRRRRPTARVRVSGGHRRKPTKRTHTRTGRPLLDVE